MAETARRRSYRCSQRTWRFQWVRLLSRRRCPQPSECAPLWPSRLLLDHLYGGVDPPELKIIDVFVCHLRKKLTRQTLYRDRLGPRLSAARSRPSPLTLVASTLTGPLDEVSCASRIMMAPLRKKVPTITSSGKIIANSTAARSSHRARMLATGWCQIATPRPCSVADVNQRPAVFAHRHNVGDRLCSAGSGISPRSNCATAASTVCSIAR
jgi:hypothetical protein